MAQLSFALFAAHENGATIDNLSEALMLPADFVRERIEAARLCLLCPLEVSE